MPGHQKCRDPERFCAECNGFGVIVKAPNVGHIDSIKALIDAGVGDVPIETVEVMCSACRGTGERLSQPKPGSE
jgi:hypothetical protein